MANQHSQEGKLLLGGAFANPADGAALIFYVEDKAQIEAFVEVDPYVQNGLVKAWNIRDYTVVIGSACENPIDIKSL